MIMKNKMKKQICTVIAMVLAVSMFLPNTCLTAEAKASYDTKHTQQLSFENLMTSAFVKEMDADVVYKEIRLGIEYGALSEGDIRHLYENMDTTIQAEVLGRLYTEGLISSYLYKYLFGGNLTASDLSKVFNAVEYADLNPDVKASLGYNESLLFQHFLLNGLTEGRVSSKAFNVQYYRANYPDLVELFGDQLGLYYQHYLLYGEYEGRVADKLLKQK